MFKIKKRNIKDLLLIVVFISFFEPNYLVQLSSLHFICQTITIIAVFNVFVVCVINHIKFNRITIYTISYGSFMVITSGFHNTLELSLLRFVLVLIVIDLYFALYGFERIRKIMLLTLSYLTILNLVLQLFARSSVESVVGPTGWFLTGSNALVSYTMPTVCLAIVSIEKKKQIWFSILSIAVCLYTAIISTTATTIFVLFLIVGVWSFQKAINMNLIKINWVVTIIVLGFFILVVFQVQEKIFLIKFIVEDVLQRDMSFTSRTFV